jgi:hypothetical protein
MSSEPHRRYERIANASFALTEWSQVHTVGYGVGFNLALRSSVVLLPATGLAHADHRARLSRNMRASSGERSGSVGSGRMFRVGRKQSDGSSAGDLMRLRRAGLARGSSRAGRGARRSPLRWGRLHARCRQCRLFRTRHPAASVARARRAPTRRGAADVARASPGVGRGECQCRTDPSSCMMPAGRAVEVEQVAWVTDGSARQRLENLRALAARAFVADTPRVRDDDRRYRAA